MEEMEEMEDMEEIEEIEGAVDLEEVGSVIHSLPQPLQYRRTLE